MVCVDVLCLVHVVASARLGHAGNADCVHCGEMGECFAGAHRSWFHLYRMLMMPAGTVDEADAAEQDKAVSVEQFMQSATLGEYQSRLDLIWSFR